MAAAPPLEPPSLPQPPLFCTISAFRRSWRYYGTPAMEGKEGEGLNAISVWRSGRESSLPAVGRAHAAPGVAHLLIVSHRVVNLNPEPEVLRRKRAGRRQHSVRRDDAIALRGDERHARIDEILLGIEHVERGALADARFLAHAVERDLGGGDLRLGGIDLRLSRLELAPGLGDRRLHLIARRVEVEPALAERLLGLPDGRVFGPTLIERHGELGGDRGRQCLEQHDRLGRAEALLHGAYRAQGG